MNFVYPNFLWALLLLAIPVIIHLFNFRRYQTVYFSKVDLLNEAIEDSKSGNKLKHLLILFSRLLAIAALVFAFAQPFIPTADNINTETVSSIFIDNSFSMQAQGQDGDLLNEVKNKAIDLVASFEENEKIVLLTSELLAKDQRFYTKSEITERIKEIKLSPAATPLLNILNISNDLLNKSAENQQKRLFLFSDFQTSTSDLSKLSPSNTSLYFYQPEAEIQGNIFIDSIWFESPVQSINLPITLAFRIKNISNKPLDNLTLTININGKDKGVKTVKVGANSFVEETINYNHLTAGIKKGEIKIKTNQLFFDDQFYFTYTIQNQTNILIVNEGENNPQTFEKLYAVNPFYQHTSIQIGQLKQSDFEDKALVIFNNINDLTSGAVFLINENLKKGATVVMIPGAKANLKAWNSFLTTQNQPTLRSQSTGGVRTLNYFNDKDPLFTGVFEKSPKNYAKASIKSYFPLLVNSNQNFISLFGFNENNPFLTYSKTKNGGRLFLQAAPLLADFSNFDKQALFAATFLRIAETATFKKDLFYTIGKGGAYLLKEKSKEKSPIHLINPLFKTDLIPPIVNESNSQIVLFDQLNGELKQAGFYELTDQISFKDALAFNFDRTESIIESIPKVELIGIFKDAGWNQVQELLLNQKGKIEIENIKPKAYWRLFLFLALLFLAIEIALIKFWKTT
ncbi:hypothetical protein DNU06_04690 [Putridiphycobacter roseus]|uniref:Aerotolerance regulator N-terminal domain-containing protein n=1 Tax=Putridiphycobacter roseus TaxID=2219161 RepID=A0A2W1N074_9FLAO|nr:BatA and WFA domain-containing protein [Putridiphycobacter roseus]PZE17919.1 hypothetical protein DNU06_04690 [Putridiphycobacter roseus]